MSDAYPTMISNYKTLKKTINRTQFKKSVNYGSFLTVGRARPVALRAGGRRGARGWGLPGDIASPGPARGQQPHRAQRGGWNRFRAPQGRRARALPPSARPPAQSPG